MPENHSITNVLSPNFTYTGVVLPGETMKFPFVFKSPNAGVFTEQWKFETRPRLCGGAALIVTLRGIALQEDKFKTEREELEVIKIESFHHFS